MPFPGRWWHGPEVRDAFWLSWVSAVCTVVAAIGGVVGFSRAQSTLLLAFGLENFVDFVSSLVVLWRFYCPHGGDDTTLARLRKREERAGVAISIVIGVLGLFVFSLGILDLLEEERDGDLGLLFAISLLSIVVFGSLTIVKFKYARDLESPSLYKDGICSLIGTALSTSLLLTAAIIDYAPNAWYIDPVASLIIGVGAVVYGSRVVFHMVRNGVPIFHYDWWVTKGEVKAQELPEAKGPGGDGDHEERTAPEENVGEHEVI